MGREGRISFIKSFAVNFGCTLDLEYSCISSSELIKSFDTINFGLPYLILDTLTCIIIFNLTHHQTLYNCLVETHKVETVCLNLSQKSFNCNAFLDLQYHIYLRIFQSILTFFSSTYYLPISLNLLFGLNVTLIKCHNMVNKIRLHLTKINFIQILTRVYILYP